MNGTMTRIDRPFENQVLQHQRVREQIETLSVRLFTGKQYERAGESPVEWRESSTLRDRLSQLNTLNTSMNALGLSLGQVSHLMGTLGKYMEMLQREMEGARDAGVPPATPELAAIRDAHVKQYNALLGQINDLVNENPDELSRTLTGDPGQIAAAGDLDVVVTENGLERTIRAQELHTGPSGLDLHEMPDSPTLADLESIAFNLVDARARLQLKDRALGTDAADVARLIAQNNDLAATLDSRATSLESADLDETAAGLQSLQVQQSLLVNSSKLVHDLRTSLLEILS